MCTRYIICILWLLFSKTILLAQGPVAPEASSFEPVDATDMVNLSTGDFSYVLPLLYVPSPEGGYPINLNYHAGIAMDQEASWTGLGWNINPGTISRSIQGYPDDWKQENYTNLIYDAGGTLVSNTLSISVGWGDGIYSIGGYASWGSNRSINGENSAYFDFGATGGIKGFTGNFGTNGVGLNYSMSTSYSIKNDAGEISNIGTYSAGVGLNLNFKDGSTSINYSLESTGTSLKTGSGNGGSSYGIKASGSFNFGKNSRASGSSFSRTYKGNSYSLNFNNLIKISFNKSKIKYWLAQKRTYSTVGSLYASNLEDVLDASIYPPNEDFDSYEVNNNLVAEEAINENNLGYIAFDKYSVTAQGLGGYISPSLNEYGSVFSKRRIVKDRDYGQDNFNYSDLKTSFTKSIEDQDLYFYFDNIYSSHISQSTSNSWDALNSTYPTIQAIFDDINISSTSFNTTITDTQGNTQNNYNSTNKRITKGSYIETYTNAQILNSNVLYFQDVYADRNLANTDGIGAFVITAIDGKKYYYTIPVYQKEKFERSAKIDVDIDNAFYEEQSLTPYATHWLLTAIIGPDYVDVNSNGEIDDNDFGYWVKYDYGKWSDGYVWRTPTMDYQKTETTQKFSWGIKEIYYLDQIKTRTHTAFFIKSERNDGEANDDVEIGTSRANPKVYTESGDGFDPSVSIFTDKYGNLRFNSTYNNYTNNDIGTSGCSLWATHFVVDNGYYAKSYGHKLLKLDRIVLLQNDKIPAGFTKNASSANPHLVSEVYVTERVRTSNSCGNYDTGTQIIHDESYSGEYADNVFDVDDYNLYEEEINDAAIKSVVFNYTYDLAHNTPNSSDADGGKLTLSSANYSYRGSVNLTPPYVFDYYYSDYSINNVDEWGYKKNNTKANSLKSILTPLGSTIEVVYEEDDYFQTASDAKRYFDSGIQFTFSEYSGMLRIKIEKEQDNIYVDNIDFTDYFSTSDDALVDIWACYRHEYNQGGCQARKGIIDIPNTSVDVISVTSNQVILETSMSYTENHNEGLDWFFGDTVGLNYHPNMIREELDRGDCADPPGCINNTDRLVLKYFVHGNYNRDNINGGGLRVKEIALIDDFSAYSKKYFYNLFGYDQNKTDNNYRSSGITSYAPSKYPQKILYQSEVPAPYVIYENVTVESDELDAYYTFKVLDALAVSNNEKDIQYGIDLSINTSETIESVLQNTGNNNPTTVNRRIYNIQDRTSSIGSLLSVVEKNKIDQVVSSNFNTYRNLSDQDQGINKESFNNYEYEIDFENEIININANVTSKTIYPSVLESSQNVKSGLSYTTDYELNDFNSGIVLETIINDSRGNQIKNKIIPAYKIPSYSNNSVGYSMGSRVDNSTNKNMLSQTAATYTLIDDNGTWKPIGVGITTWNNNWTYINTDGSTFTPTDPNEKVWRKHKTYVWDGSINSVGHYVGYDLVMDDGFNWSTSAQNQAAPWKMISEITKYDHFSMPLEGKSINSKDSNDALTYNFAATKMTDKDSKVILVSNTMYGESFYTGAEYANSSNNWLDQQIDGSSLRTLEKSHTGAYSLKINPSSNFRVILKGDTYRTGVYKLSAWVHKDNYTHAKVYQPDGQTVAFNGEKVFAGNWVQLNHYYSMNYSAGDKVFKVLSDSGDIYVDDVRLHPRYASLTSYVYNDQDELTFILGANNIATKYQYDAAGRLIRIYAETENTSTIMGGFKLYKKFNYNYGPEIDAGGTGEIHEVYFCCIEKDNCSGPTTARLNAPPGSTVHLTLQLAGDSVDNFSASTSWGGSGGSIPYGCSVYPNSCYDTIDVTFDSNTSYIDGSLTLYLNGPSCGAGAILTISSVTYNGAGSVEIGYNSMSDSNLDAANCTPGGSCDPGDGSPLNICPGVCEAGGGGGNALDCTGYMGLTQNCTATDVVFNGNAVGQVSGGSGEYNYSWAYELSNNGNTETYNDFDFVDGPIAIKNISKNSPYNGWSIKFICEVIDVQTGESCSPALESNPLAINLNCTPY